MAMREIELDAIGQAIIDTNKEIAAEAWDKEDIVEDASGDRTPETMGGGLEGQHEPDDDDEPEPGEGEGDESDSGEGEADLDKGKVAADGANPNAGDTAPARAEGDNEPRVPPGRLREQTERARAAEAALNALKAEREAERAQSRKDMDALNARIDGILAATRQPTSKAAEVAGPVAAPDPLIDPEGFVSHVTKGFETELSKRDHQLAAIRVETSMQIAAGRHGDSFAKAYDAIGKLDRMNPDDQMTVRRIWAAPNPGEALVKWHRSQETLREVGEDPVKYKDRIAQETREALMKDPDFRKSLIEAMQQEASGANDGRPRTITRLPKSLNGAAGGNARRDTDPLMHDDSDQAVADSAWR